MATLRDNLFVDNNLTPEQRLALEAGQQSSLRRGYTAGRLGVESNYLAAQEASLRASGRNAEADELRNEIGMLQARQSAFAPEVGDLRQIDGLGTLGSYVAGQVGQGVASMQDSAATALGVAAATRLGPIARAVGQMGRPAQVITAAAPGAAALGVNQRQMTGEFYNSAVQDPTIMATHSAQDLNQVANAYGLAGGALDTLLPAAVARRVVGGRGLLPTTLRQQGVGTGTRIGLDMLGEGATETAQQFGQQQVLGMLNPNRDTSEDGWELANAAVGGALGGGPISAASQLAGGARERIGDVVGGKAGDEFDMATGKPKGGPNAPTSRAAKLKEMFSRREVDLGEGAAPGAPTAPRLSPEDLDVLNAEPPEDMSAPGAMEQFAQGLEKAGEVAQRYLTGSQDPAAQALLSRLAPENDPADRRTAQMEAAQFVAERVAQDDLVRRAEAGGAGERAARAVASAATRGLASAAKGAWKMGKAAMDGVKDAATKKNLQTTDDKVQRLGDNLGAFLRGESASVPLSQRSSKMGQHFQRLGEDLGDLIETSEANRKTNKKGSGLPPRLMRQTLDMADDLLTAFGAQGAVQRVAEMQRVAGGQGKAVFETLTKMVTDSARNLNVVKARNQRELGLSLIRHMDPVQAQEAYADADLRDAIIRAVDTIARGVATPQQRMAVVRAVGGNDQLDAMLREYNGDSEEAGNPNSLWDDMADEGQYVDPDDSPDFGSDAVIEVADESGKPRRNKESKKTRFVGFHKKGDIAVPDVKKGVSAFEKYVGKVKDDEGRPVEKSVRPRLFEDGTMVTVDLPDGTKGQVSGIQKKMDDLVKQLGPETAARKVDALQLMDEEGMDTPAKMALYRDYLRQDADDNRGIWTDEHRKEVLRRARAASAYVIDSIDMKVVDGKAREGKRMFRLSPQERQTLEEDMTEYFARRYAVVAESVVDEAPEKFTIKDLTSLKREADPAVEIARKFRETDPARMYQILDENNIITFSRKGKALNMRADDLVKWARNERRKGEASDLERNEDAKDLAPMWRDEQFVADLAMGMGAVLDSGLVDAKVAPYKTNAKGEQEQFTGKKLPGSLRLATMTVAEYRKKRRELADEVLSRPPLSERDEVQTEQRRQEEVAKDLTREEPAIEPLAGTEVDPVIDPATYASMTLEERDQLRQLPSKAARDEFMANLSLRKSGERFSTQPTSSAPGNVAEDVTEITTRGVKVTRRVENGRLRLQDMPGDTIQEKQAAMERLRGSDRPSMFGDRRAAFTSPRSDDMGKTPLDFFGPDKRDLATQGYDDEFTDQRTRSRAQGFDPTRDLPRPVSPMQAKRFAEVDAKKLADTLRKQPAEAFAEIESRLKSAARPKEGDERGLTGGIHYIYPVTRVLNGDELGGLDLGPAEAARAFELRRQAARVLMKVDLKPAERVRLARELATAQAAERITAQNVMTALQKIAGDAKVADEPAPAQAPAKAEPSADRAYEKEVMRRVTKEDYAGLDTKEDADRFLKTAHTMWQRGKAREAEMNSMAEAQDDAVQDRAEKALAMLRALDGLFAEGSYAQTDLGSFYEGIAPMSDDEVRAMLKGAAPEVATQAPKSSAAPAGAPAKANAQTGAVEGDNSQEAQIKAKEYLHKVLPGVRLQFEEITGYSGEWIEAENIIRVSTQSAPGTLQTTYHEAMHAFFSKFLKNNPEAMRVMRSLAENQKVMDRVVALLAKYPAARQQLVDGEERLAYIYQFWAAGLLELPQGRPATIMQKVRKFLRRAAGMITDTERAVEILEAFHSGEAAKPSFAGRVLADIINQGTMTTKARRKFDKQLQAVYAAVVPAETVLATSASKTARKLAKQFFTNPGDDESAGMEPGYLNARRVVASQYSNRFARIVDGMTKADMTEITKLLQQKVKPEDIAYVPHRRAVERIRDLLGNFYEYMSDGRGLPVADAGRDYFPTVWDFDKLVEKKREFIDLVTNKYKRDGEELWNHMVGATSKAQAQQDVTHVGGVLNPFFAGKEKIELPWFEAADREQFLQKDLVEIMTTYFHRGARAAEYHYRFGEDGINLQKDLERVRSELMEEARKQLKDGKFDDAQQAEAWAQRQYKQVVNATAAMEGSLGKDTDEKWRKVTSWITAYQNVRLLPLTLFASFVDPLNMVSRGATMKEAYETFLRGMTEVFRNWRNMMRSEPVPTKMDKWTQLAEDIGAVDSLMFSEFVSEQYSSGYMAPGAKKLNDWFFRINGMEAWNRGMRSGAVRSAVRFIERHTKNPETHSARWLKELGLTPTDVKFDADGELITSVKGLQDAGMSPTQARAAAVKIHQAINRWVEGAVLTPNAAQRPSWASDPRWSFMFHLKQFSYSFHQTILKRGIKEMNYGNMAPLGSFLWYVPTMIAADVFKGLIQGGGELPPSMQGLTLGDWVMRGIERAGFLGVPGIAFEGTSDPVSLMGPAVDQVFDAITDPADKTVLRAMPGMPLYSNWVQ